MHGEPRSKTADLGGYLEARSRQGFDCHLKSRATFEATLAELKRQLRFIGDSGAVYRWLWSVAEPTRPREEWFTADRRQGPGRARAGGGAHKLAMSAT